MVDHHLPGPQSFAQSAADTPSFETTTHLFILHRYCDGTGGGAGGGGGVQGLNGLAVVMFLPTQSNHCLSSGCVSTVIVVVARFFADATATSKTGPNQARHNRMRHVSV
eukprot:COSAG06_NODE_338_length_17232_cov_73.406584_3_plen_109_part_00